MFHERFYLESCGGGLRFSVGADGGGMTLNEKGRRIREFLRVGGEIQGDTVGLGSYRRTNMPVGVLEGGQLMHVEEQ